MNKFMTLFLIIIMLLLSFVLINSIKSITQIFIAFGLLCLIIHFNTYIY